MSSFDWRKILGGVWLWAGLLALSPAFAEHLGRLAKVYPIQEEDSRKVLKAQIAKKYKSAEEVRTKNKKLAVDFLNNLPAVEGIRKAQQNRTRFMDLTHVFAEDLHDDKGRVVAKAGTRVNLLSGGKIKDMLLILDGRDPRQVAMLDRLWRSEQKVVPILVAGSHTQLTHRYKRSFFYDYGGAASRAFGVDRVPALIGQDGDRIRIEELKP
jgi:conjugal transfer pilus assembly protein TraW